VVCLKIYHNMSCACLLLYRIFRFIVRVYLGIFRGKNGRVAFKLPSLSRNCTRQKKRKLARFPETGSYIFHPKHIQQAHRILYFPHFLHSVLNTIYAYLVIIIISCPKLIPLHELCNICAL
jgi:hypothetical protein